MKQTLVNAVINHGKELVQEVKPVIDEYVERYTKKEENTFEINEDKFYEIAMIEIEEDKKIKSVWAKALVQAEGNKEKLESFYIQLRVNILIQEEKIAQVLQNEKIEAQRAEELKIEQNRLDEEKIEREKLNQKRLNAVRIEREARFQKRLDDEQIAFDNIFKFLKILFIIGCICAGLFFAYDIITDKFSIEKQLTKGNEYYLGKEVPQDYKKAFEWYEKAANQGNYAAQYALGNMYKKGEGVTQDYKKAFEYYTLSANQGDADAQSNLGLMYVNGQGVKQDYKKAKDLFGKACDGGYLSGCDNYKELNQKGY